MSLSAKPISMISIIYYLRMIILLFMGFMISPSEAAVSCTSASPQCCWVISAWQKMGKTTSVSATSPTACCYYRGSTTQTTGIPGVTCTAAGTVLQLDWNFKGLKNYIPSSDIEKLYQLNLLALYDNPYLGGTITPKCTMKVYVSNTKIKICGCAAKGIPALRFPSAGTPDSCLATGPSSPLQKRTEIFSQNIGSYKFTCNVDYNKNPFQDCLNAQARICNSTYMGNNVTRLIDCKTGVNKMVYGMSPLWQAVRRECGQWPWIDGFTGNKDSSNCNTANAALIQNAYYSTDRGKVNVTSDLTNSVKVGLWSNPKIGTPT